MQITVLNVAHRKHEPNSFVYIRENGFGPDVFLFVHFILPAIVTIDGVEHFADKDACIIYPPELRQEYRHHNGVFLNDFLIVKCTDPFFIAKFGLPENEIFYVSNGVEISNLMESITYTITDKTIDRSRETPRFVQRLFETLSKLCVDMSPNLRRTYELRKRFAVMRDEVCKNPKGWTVKKMAERVWLTRSRFTVLYTELLKISPSADLIGIKIAHAKKLLVGTDLPVAEVSEHCGYTSVGHFIRIFCKHAGCTPLRYRKKHAQSKQERQA